MALTDNLQAFYKLSDTSDSSGNNRTLTNNGNVSFASGKIGNAAVFDGSNSLTQETGLNISSSFSIAGWVFSDTTESNKGWIFLSSDTENGLPVCGFWFQPSDARQLHFSCDYGQGWSDRFLSNGSVPMNQWTHITLSQDATGVKFYVNGQLDSFHEQIDSSIIASNAFSFGTDFPFYSQQFSGSMDAVGIWNRALSDAEVAELYNNGTGLELPAGPAVKNGWIDNIFWINDVATTLDQNGNGTWVGKLYKNGSLFSGSKYSLTFVDGVAQAEQIVTVIGSNIPVAFGLNEAEEPLVELVFGNITSAGETVIEQIIPTVLPTGYTVAETVLAYSIDTTATFEGSINVDFILPSNISQAVFDRVKGFHVKNSGAIEEMARVSSDFSTKRITVAITSFSDFLFLDEPQVNKSVKVTGKSKFIGKVKFAAGANGN